MRKKNAKSRIYAVVAIGRNRELGKGNKLIWHIPDDLKRFKALTMGHPIIMGRKTFESILGYRGSPLPDRTNIVITRSARYEKANPLLSKEGYKAPNVTVVESLEEALEKAKEAPGSEEIHIGGGAQIYEQALPLIDKLYLTLIDAEAPGADPFFPPYEHRFTKKTFEEEHERGGLRYKYVNLERG